MKISVVNSVTDSFCWNYATDTFYSNLMQNLRFYCNYAGGTFCHTYVGGSFVAFMKVTVSVAIMQLEVSATPSENFPRKYVSDNFN